MSFFISDAMAEGTAAAQGGGDLMGLVPLILLFVIFYFLLIRPQQKRVKEHRKMTEELKKGDEISTMGGLVGRIVELDDSFVELEIAANTTVKVQRQSVQSLMPKGTL